MAGVPVEDCIASDEDSHTIGTLAFAPDGSLFVSSGDGSNYGGVDPRALRSQLLDSLNGKVLRINPDGSIPAVVSTSASPLTRSRTVRSTS